jgi:GTP-binding protein HflX
VIITDTVGFIQDLPKDLMVAFRATLEELENADLLVHVIDVSNPRFEEQMRSVDNILAELNLNRIPCLLVLNKQDRVDAERIDILRDKFDAIAISANNPKTLMPLIERMSGMINGNDTDPHHPEDHLFI